MLTTGHRNSWSGKSKDKFQLVAIGNCGFYEKVMEICKKLEETKFQVVSEFQLMLFSNMTNMHVINKFCLSCAFIL